MLTISNDAATAVRQLLARPGVPQGCSLRIQRADGLDRLRILLVTSPAPGDTVYEIAGFPGLLVAEEVAARVDGRTLGARLGEKKRVRFVLDAPVASRERRAPAELTGAGVS
ncbi:MAG: hypothetical protein SYR96_19025 [Actinomycetota bacterium]|nr:hypothetical protein [Actinomycetota bacterium]